MSLTAKQEAFCQAVLSGLSQADAYRKAYSAGKMKPATVQESASRLMANSKVAARVKELRAPVVAEVQYDLKVAMSECERALLMAEKLQKPAAMVQAIALRSKLHGLLVDRSEVRVGPLDALEHDELKKLNAAIGAIAAAGGTVSPGAGSTVH